MVRVNFLRVSRCAIIVVIIITIRLIGLIVVIVTPYKCL